MDQDLFEANLGLVGFYTLYCLIVYLIGRQVALKRAVRYSIGCWVGLIAVMMWVSVLCSIVVFMILFVTSLIIFPPKVDTRLQAFFTANRIYKATTVPAQVAQLLGPHYYSCAEATLTTQSGQDVRFNWWQGLTSSMSKVGNAYISNVTCYLALSFEPNTISDAFKQLARTAADASGLTFRQKVRRAFVLDTDTPIAIQETEDGSFVIIWQTHHDVERFTNCINWLKANLSVDKPTFANHQPNGYKEAVTPRPEGNPLAQNRLSPSLLIRQRAPFKAGVTAFPTHQPIRQQLSNNAL